MLKLIRKIFFLVITATAFLYARTNVPPCWQIVSENFESGNLDDWNLVSSSNLSLETNAGIDNSTALHVNLGQSERYIYQSNVMNAEEAYLDFYFNPVGLNFPITNTWLPGRAVRIADIKGGAEWHTLVALRVYEPTNNVYYAYLSWHGDSGVQHDYSSGSFLLTNGWQKITIGYRVDDFVAAWLNDEFMREVTGVEHEQAAGSIIEIGKANYNYDIIPSGSIHFDNVNLLVPKILNIYVDAENGNDTNSGATVSSALKTISRAAELAGPGATIHILPGIYRETVTPIMSGIANAPIKFIAENGTNTVFIRGSQPASDFVWAQLPANTIGLPPSVEPTNIWYANITGMSAPPRFIIETDAAGNYYRLLQAREPDFLVSNEWKRHEFWWAADGGSAIPTSTVDNADLYTRSFTQLLDQTDDTEPAGIEAGNLTSLGNLVGAMLVAIDTLQGHYVYRRTITNHNVATGLVTVDKICEHDSGSGKPGLGAFSKYYVEGKPYLLDTPGEWWFDSATSNLYIFPCDAGNPANQNLEISARSYGLKISDVSYNIFDSINLEIFNGSAVYSGSSKNQKSYSNTVENAEVSFASYGVYLAQGVSTDTPAANVTDGFTLENSKVHHIDNRGFVINYWWDNTPSAETFPRPGIINTTIISNDFFELGFRSDADNAVGLSFQFPDKVTLAYNHFHNIAHNGVQFSRSVIRSDKTYGFDPSEILTGNILVKNNIFENCCELTTDNGGLKFWGSPPDHHVFKNVLVCKNISRYNYGWTFVAEKRGRWTAGHAKGTGGCGFYVDMCSGIDFFRNIAYKNGYEGFRFSGVWRDGYISACNNIAANSIYGLNFGWSQADTHGCVGLEVFNNILINNEGYAIIQSDADGIYSNIFFDHNLYSSNGWGGQPPFWKPGDMAIYRGDALNEYYQTVPEITAAGYGWETNGFDKVALFENYNLADHDAFYQNYPDFHLTSLSSNAIDNGTDFLPDSLTNVLNVFNVSDEKAGDYFDIGAYEFVPEPVFIYYLLFLIYYLIIQQFNNPIIQQSNNPTIQ